MTIKALGITQCKECGSTHLTWQNMNTTTSGIAQGRLRTGDVSCLFFLGCDDCSETLATLSADTVTRILNEQREQLADTAQNACP